MFAPSEEKFTKIERIAVISDSALGFGSPDIIGLTDGLCKRFGAQGLLVQPDDINRPIVKLEFEADVKSLRLYSILPTYTQSWRWHFFRQAAKAVDDFKADVVIVVGPNGYGASRALKRRPKLLVYYMLEMITHEPLYADLHERGNDDIDCYIVPDIERHDIDFGALKWKKDVPIERILLTAAIDYPRPLQPLAHDKRNGALLYFGSIHPEETLLDNLLIPEFDETPIDFFGRISGSNRAAVVNRITVTPEKTYGGLLSPSELAETLPRYLYSLVTWKPIGSVARYHLPATKLYHSVLAGVPVIAVPNPLNSYWIRKAGVGILLDSWNRAAFVSGLKSAIEMAGTDAYRQMVDNCRKVSEGEFLWSVQVERAAALIDRQIHKKWAQLYARKRRGAAEEAA